jgi:hypothetical protein
MKYVISTNDNQVLFTDAKGKTEKFDFIEAIGEGEAINSLKGEIKARHNATQGCLSLMVQLLDTAKLDEYKGKTPANEGLSKEFKSAVREIETEYLKPLFVAPLEKKGNSPATIQKLWTTFIEDLRAGGVWSNVGATVRQYFAIVGKLPCLYLEGKPQKNKLLSTHAMAKEIANLRTVNDTTDRGVAGKLHDLLDIVENRTEKTNLGHTGTAIAALEKLLNHYRAIDAYEREQALVAYQKKADSEGMQSSVTDVAHAVVQKAKKNKGQVSSKSKEVQPAPL